MNTRDVGYSGVDGCKGYLERGGVNGTGDEIGKGYLEVVLGVRFGDNVEIEVGGGRKRGTTLGRHGKSDKGWGRRSS